MFATASYDVFDTLLVRPVLRPTDVFVLVERELGVPGWAVARVRAEREARATKPHFEVTLDEIYRAPALAPWQRRAAELRAAELRWEEQLRVIPAMAERVQRDRAGGARIAYVSDMYLPAEFIAARLDGVRQPDDVLHVSHEAQDSKGRTWWRTLAAQYPQPWRHVGDNPHSDVAAPRAHGIETEWFGDAHPNIREQTLDAENPDAPLAAGLSRLARLLRPPGVDAMWDDGANISGPLFHGFAHWVLQEAKQRGITAVYFLARDGELPSRIAALLRAQDPTLPEVHYLAGSRHAWYNAMADPGVHSHRVWLSFAGTPTIRGVLSNLEIVPEDIAEPLTRAGFPRATWDEPRSMRARRTFFERVARDAEASAFFARRRHERLAPLLAYFESLGVFRHQRVGLVDIGWSGSMLAAFQELLGASGERAPEATGFFFGLHQNARPDRLWYACGPRIWPHWSVSFPSVIEMLTPGTHGQVLGYGVREDGIAAPRLHHVLVAPASVLTALHAGALKYVELALQYEQPPPRCVRLLRGFLVRPTTAEIARWQRFSFCTWQGPEPDESESLVRVMSRGELVRRILSPWRRVELWPWPTAAWRRSWPRVPDTALSLLVLKFRVDLLVWWLCYFGGGQLRRLKRMISPGRPRSA